MAIFSSMHTSTIPDLNVTINYNTQNLRITSVDWVLTQGAVKVTIYSNGSPFIYNIGVGNGSQTIPGNHRLVETVDDDGNNVLVFPPQLGYIIEVVS